MIPIAGGIGIGLVWGWLVGGRYVTGGSTIRSLLFVILTCSVLAAVVCFAGGWMGTLAFLVSVVVCGSLHYLWRVHLLQKRMAYGGPGTLGG